MVTIMAFRFTLIVGTLIAVTEAMRTTYDLHMQASGACEKITVPQCQNAPYNYTRMPNILKHMDQIQAAKAILEWIPLIQTQCSPNLEFFLCSIFTPMCAKQVSLPLVACRSVCEEVQNNCAPLLKDFGLPWPDMLNCTKFPQSDDLCMDPTQSGGGNTKPALMGNRPRQSLTGTTFGKLSPGIARTNIVRSSSFPRSTETNKCNKIFFRMDAASKDSPCTVNCELEVRFSSRDRQFAEVWMAVWATLCFAATIFTVFTLCLNRDRFRYPERPIIWMSACYFVYSFGYLLRFCLGSANVVCARNKAGCSFLVQNESTGEWCTVIFVLLYYFGMASMLWWVILALTWFLAAGRKWSTEGIEVRSSYFHLIAWAVPAIQSIVILILKKVDGDELTGLCYVGNNDPGALVGFVIAPMVIYLIIGTVFIIAGFIGMLRLRRFFQLQMVTETVQNMQRLERLMCRIGMFSLLYVVSAGCVVGCLVYEKLKLDDWSRVVDTCDARAASLGPKLKPPVELFMLKLFMSLVVGITSGMWIWSRKTCRTWLRCCGFYQEQKSAHYQTAPVNPTPNGAVSQALYPSYTITFSNDVGVTASCSTKAPERKRLLAPMIHNSSRRSSALAKL